ncbi:X-Pro dipeptidase [Pseudonocardia sulfidoxydans NBRC 16205]|uniref:X-Pro dipeptidase n=1 Tax=Pseudonocardia sulfidoxydans NBRC 16205 TaxID=1223511 RepID=A0A511DI86_9PSEU|nr:Xaa-Pro peptidase family protein [Pseudonocardia sulfidoxydans]GEL24033.1 X-Pro dipeptidase [Pseudonocardia sulfidoxydans NBRC 16205]
MRPFGARRDRLRALLGAAGVDALLVTALVDVRYLTGFTGSNAALLVAADGEARSRFCTDGRYVTQSAEEVPDLETVVDRGSVLALARRAPGLGITRLGFESDVVTVDGLTAVDAASEGVELVRAPGLTPGLRAVKDDVEIAALRTACAVADAALADLVAAGGIAAGRTEREVALDLENRMRGHGASGPAFETIMAAGAHSAIPHHSPTDAPLRRGDLVKIDFGAIVDGYHSDTTRTFVLGPAAGWQRDLHDLVARAQRAGCAALAPGAAVAAVDAAARDVVVAAGQGERFVHGLGHGVGLEIHEAPWLSSGGAGELAAGMVVTVEPGVYLEGRGGVRIEDTLAVLDGGTEPLTLAPHELVEV